MSQTVLSDPTTPIVEDPTSDRSVRRAGLVAGIAGLVGMALLCCVFIDADFIIWLAGYHEILGWLLALLLLLTVGGYAMLAFYGFRLRSAWKIRRQPPDGRRRHHTGRLALSDLRKIRWYSGATMLAILIVYLTPSKQPSFNAGWGSYNDGPSWKQTPAAIRGGVLLWTAAAAAVVLIARRAAWDLAAASGDLSGPDDVRAFEVLAPGALQATRASRVPATPLLAIPLSRDGSPATPSEFPILNRPIRAQPLEAPRLSPASVTADARALPMERLAAAELLGNRRDWEMVLLTLMVLLLLVAVDVVGGSRDLRADLYNPKALSDTYDSFSSRVVAVWFSAAPPPPPTKPDTFNGTLAVAAHAGDLLIIVLAITGVLWVSICLMSGPRWRRPVIMLLALVPVLLLYDRFASNYFSHGYSERVRYRDGGVYNTISLETGILPLMLIVVLTRPPVHSLFDQRVRKRRKSTAAHG